MDLNAKRVLYLDSLAAYCFNYNSAQNDDAQIYRLYRKAIIHPDFVSPTERTLAELKNSGSMRLIRKKTAADSIVMYDDMAKKLADQQAYYERYQNETIESSFQLMNFQNYGLGAVSKTSVTHATAKLINPDKIKLMEFGNRVDVYLGVVSFYNIRLGEMKQHAINLLHTLTKEYHLENE